MTYWYKLQDVDIYGNSTFHGPVTAAAEPQCGAVAGATGSTGPACLCAALFALAWLARRSGWRKVR